MGERHGHWEDSYIRVILEVVSWEGFVIIDVQIHAIHLWVVLVSEVPEPKAVDFDYLVDLSVSVELGQVGK